MSWLVVVTLDAAVFLGRVAVARFFFAAAGVLCSSAFMSATSSDWSLAASWALAFAVFLWRLGADASLSAVELARVRFLVAAGAGVAAELSLMMFVEVGRRTGSVLCYGWERIRSARE